MVFFNRRLNVEWGEVERCLLVTSNYFSCFNSSCHLLIHGNLNLKSQPLPNCCVTVQQSQTGDHWLLSEPQMGVFHFCPGLDMSPSCIHKYIRDMLWSSSTVFKYFNYLRFLCFGLVSKVTSCIGNRLLSEATK